MNAITVQEGQGFAGAISDNLQCMHAKRQCKAKLMAVSQEGAHRTSGMAWDSPRASSRSFCVMVPRSMEVTCARHDQKHSRHLCCMVQRLSSR
jgi:hypothetical protein